MFFEMPSIEDSPCVQWTHPCSHSFLLPNQGKKQILFCESESMRHWPPEVFQDLRCSSFRQEAMISTGPNRAVPAFERIACGAEISLFWSRLRLRPLLHELSSF